MSDIYKKCAKDLAVGCFVGIVVMFCTLVMSGIITIGILPVRWPIWLLAMLFPLLFGCFNAMD